jgi:hypothetical protein
MMNEEPRDVSLLIGLHKLAEQNGEGLVPELYALLSERANVRSEAANVVAFPIGSVPRPTDTSRNKPGRVLAFRR